MLVLFGARGVGVKLERRSRQNHGTTRTNTDPKRRPHCLRGMHLQMHCSVRHKEIEGGNRGRWGRKSPSSNTQHKREISRSRSEAPKCLSSQRRAVRAHAEDKTRPHAEDKTRLDSKTRMNPSVSMDNRLTFDPATDTTNTHWYQRAYTPGAGYPAPGPENPWRPQTAWLRSPLSGPMDIPVKQHGDGFAPASTGHVHVPEGARPGGNHPLQRQ